MSDEEKRDLEFLGQVNKEALVWYDELPDDQACDSVLQSLQKKLEEAVRVRETVSVKGEEIDSITLSLQQSDRLTVVKGLLQEEISFLKQLAFDLEEGVETESSIVRNRILSSLGQLIRGEKEVKDSDEKVVDAPTMKLANKIDTDNFNEKRQKGILDLWEIDVADRACQYLLGKWGPPRKDLRGEELAKRLEKMTPIDVSSVKK